MHPTHAVRIATLCILGLALAAPAGAVIEVQRGTPLPFEWTPPADGADGYLVQVSCNNGASVFEVRTHQTRVVVHSQICGSIQVQVTAIDDSTGQMSLPSPPSERVDLIGPNPPVAPGALGVEGGEAGTADFDGDGFADLLLHDGTGSLELWANGHSPPVALPWPSLAEGKEVAATGDLNGDGVTDFLWFDPETREVGACIVHLGYPITEVVLDQLPHSWSVVGTGDFDGDGRDEPLVRRGPYLDIWQIEPLAIVASERVSRKQMVNRFPVAAIGDFDGDGHDDLLFHDPNKGTGEIWYMEGSTVTHVLEPGAELTAKREVRGVGDLNGDGRDEIIFDAYWWSKQDRWTAWFFDANGTPSQELLSIGRGRRGREMLGTADVDGDGNSDVLMRMKGENVKVFLMTGAQHLAVETLGSLPHPWGMVQEGEHYW